jgi:hypothetical protein
VPAETMLDVTLSVFVTLLLVVDPALLPQA